MLGFSAVNYLLNNITVEEDVVKRTIEVKGLRPYVLENDIEKVLKTSRITSNIFKRKTMTSFVIPSFFALELVSVLESIIAYRYKRTSLNSLKTLVNKLRSDTWLKTLGREFAIDPKRLSGLKVTMLKYQEEFIKNYLNATRNNHLRGYLANMAAGSGKTLTALMLAEYLDFKRVVIVCPMVAVSSVWEATIRKEYNKPQTVWSSINSTSNYSNERFAVVHYEYLTKFTDSYKDPKIKTLFILDESHNLNEINTLRTQKFMELVTKSKESETVYLSGTPFKSKPLELIPIFRVVDPLFTPDVEDRFKMMFRGNNPEAARLLLNRLDFISFKVLKEEIGLKDPEFETIRVKISGSERYTIDSVKSAMRVFTSGRLKYYAALAREHEEFFNAMLAKAFPKIPKSEVMGYQRDLVVVRSRKKDPQLSEVIKRCNLFEKNKIMPLLEQEERKRFADIKSAVKYVDLKIMGECLAGVLGRLRQECYSDIARNFDFSTIIEETAKKTVIFTSFVETANVCIRSLTDLDFTPIGLYGKDTANKDVVIGKYINDPKINPIVASYKALSTAVPLVVADRMILLDTPFRDYILQQAVSRIHRLGATSTVKIYTLMLDTGTEYNLTERNVDILSITKKVVEEFTGVSSPYDISKDVDGDDSRDPITFGFV